MTGKLLIVVSAAMFAVGNLQASVTLSGTVTDRSGKPVADAAVAVENGPGAFTDADGVFHITIDTDTPVKLSVSHISFRAFSVKVDPETVRADGELNLRFKDLALHGIDGVTVTAQRGMRSSESVSLPLAFVGSRAVKEEFFRNAADMLDMIPGVRVIRTGESIGTDFGLSIRSLNGGPSSDKTLVMVDGVPLNNAWNGGVDMNALPVEGIERIEVVKGSSSALYGSRATAGVINVISSEPDREGLSLYASTAYETGFAEELPADDPAYNRPTVLSRDNQFRAQWSDPENTVLFTLGQRGADNSYPVPDTVNTYSENDVYLRFNHRFSTGLRVTASSRYHKSSQDNPWFDNFRKDLTTMDHMVGADLQAGSYMIDSRLYTNRYSGSQETITAALRTEDKAVRLGWNANVKRAFFHGSGMLNTGLDITVDNADILSSSAVESMQPYGANEVTVFDSTWDGSNLQIDTTVYRGDLFRGSTGSLDNSFGLVSKAWYFQYEQRLFDRLNITGGSRIDIHPEFGTVVSPKLGAAVEIFETKGYSIHGKMNYGQGFRAPDLQGLYSKSLDGYGDTEIQPEKTENFDLGMVFRFRDRGYMEVSWFKMNVDNLIINDKTGPAGYGYWVYLEDTGSWTRFYQRRNLGDYSPTGWELALKTELLKGLTYSLAYTWLDPGDFTFQTSSRRYNQRLSFRYGLTRDLRLSGSVTEDFTGDGFFFDFENMPFDAFSVWDARLSLEYRNNIRAGIILKNIADETYRHWHYAYQPGRSALLKLELSY